MLQSGEDAALGALPVKLILSGSEKVKFPSNKEMIMRV